MCVFPAFSLPSFSCINCPKEFPSNSVFALRRIELIHQPLVLCHMTLFRIPCFFLFIKCHSHVVNLHPIFSLSYVPSPPAHVIMHAIVIQFPWAEPPRKCTCHRPPGGRGLLINSRFHADMMKTRRPRVYANSVWEQFGERVVFHFENTAGRKPRSDDGWPSLSLPTAAYISYWLLFKQRHHCR